MKHFPLSCLIVEALIHIQWHSQISPLTSSTQTSLYPSSYTDQYSATQATLSPVSLQIMKVD